MDRSVYGLLADLNRLVGESLTVLERLAEFPELQQRDFAMRRIRFQEQLANVNIEVLHHLGETEQKWMLEAYRGRRDYEKELRDPDDCYFEVARREKERAEQGLPSLIGVVLRGRLTVEPGDARTGSSEDESQPHSGA
jgi:hypothetical protein